MDTFIWDVREIEVAIKICGRSLKEPESANKTLDRRPRGYERTVLGARSSQSQEKSDYQAHSNLTHHRAGFTAGILRRLAPRRFEGPALCVSRSTTAKDRSESSCTTIMCSEFVQMLLAVILMEFR